MGSRDKQEKDVALISNGADNAAVNTDYESAMLRNIIYTNITKWTLTRQGALKNNLGMSERHHDILRTLGTS